MATAPAALVAVLAVAPLAVALAAFRRVPAALHWAFGGRLARQVAATPRRFAARRWGFAAKR
jgi:hypothetical protein